MRKFLPLSYLRSAGAVYVLMLFPTKMGRQEISRQKRARGLRGQYYPFKIGITYRDRSKRLAEIRKDMAAYGSVRRLAIFWMFYYKDKEHRLLNKQWKDRAFVPSKAGPAAGKDEWRFLTPAEALLTLFMLFSHWVLFMAANVALLCLPLFFMLPDQQQADILQYAISIFHLLFSELKYTFV